MHRFTVSGFQTGMDRRRVESDSQGQHFYDIVNAYLSARKRVQKRPGIRQQTHLQVTNRGLFPFAGKLWTFSAQTNPVGETQIPADPTIWLNGPPEIWVVDLNDGRGIDRVEYVGVILGGLYCVVSYGDGSIDHFYVVLDTAVWESEKHYDATPEGLQMLAPAQVDATARIVKIDYFWEAEALGDAIAGGTEPAWPKKANALVRDGEIKWRAVKLRAHQAEQAYSYSANGLYVDPGQAGFVYKATNLYEDSEPKQSGAGAVTWPTVAGETVLDGEVVWEAKTCPTWADSATHEIDYPLDEENPDVNVLAHTYPSAGADGFVYVGTRISVAGGAVAPTAPTAEGAEFIDGSITWRSKSTRVVDENCPRSKEVLVHQSKVYAIGSTLKNEDETDIVRFSATSDPFDWSAPDDAGFLPVGVQSTGSEVARALGKYDDKLVVLLQDNIQLWAVDPDPQRNALVQVIGDIGTTLSRTVQALGRDLIFLSRDGFRSLSQQQNTTNLNDLDIGSPIDDVVVESLRASRRMPLATHYSAFGQYLCAIDKTIWAWTWSRNSKVRGWSRYQIRRRIDYFAQLDNLLYLRGDNSALFLLDETRWTDYDENYPVQDHDYDVLIDGAFQSLKSIGVMKQVIGVDALLTGEAKVSFKYDPNDVGKETLPVLMSGNSRPGQLTPVEVVSTEVAPVLRYTGPNDMRFDALSIYYEELGLV